MPTPASTAPIDRWFRDQLAMHGPRSPPSSASTTTTATSPSGGRDAVDEEVAFYRAHHRRAVRRRPGRADPRARPRPRPRHPPGAPRPLLADRVPAVGRLVRRRPAHRRGALPALHPRLRAARASGSSSIAARLEQAPRYLARDARARDRPGARCGPRSTSSRPSSCPAFLDTIVAAAASEGAGDDARSGSSGTRPTRRRPRSRTTPPGCADDVLPRADGRLDGRTRALRGDGPAPRARGRRRRDPRRRRGAARVREGGARRARLARSSPAPRRARCSTSSRTTTPPPSSSRWRSTAPAMDARAIVRGRPRHRHAAGGGPPRTSSRRRRSSAISSRSRPTTTPAKFDPAPVGTYIVTPPSSPEMMREHNRASIGNTSVHEAYPGHHHPAGGRDHEPEPGAPLLRRARVQRGLGLLLRADDEGGRIRRHARRAGTSSTPMPSGARPGSSSTSSSIAGSSASTRRSTGSWPRPGSSVRRRWPRSSATPRRRPTSCRTCSGAT